MCCACAPQINALKEGGFGWLHEMLECFNSGALRSVTRCDAAARCMPGALALLAAGWRAGGLLVAAAAACWP
jgi:hypothetical protein